MDLIEKWTIRLVQDPYGLVNPVWDLHISQLSNRLFDTEEAAKQAILESQEHRFGMAYVITKIYFKSEEQSCP